MAETLLGPHRDLVCDDCGHAFSLGVDEGFGPRAVCPNCGHAENETGGRPDLAGDRVLLNKAVFQTRRPRRWEVVAFRDPARPDRVALKRVVGLPGETVEIREGDVFIDGRIQRKTLEKQLAMAILVHDAAHRPAIPRWRCEATSSAWNFSEGAFTHPDMETPNEIDWLTYHHAHRVGGQWRPSAVTDVVGYNAGPRRVEDLHEVTDLLLSICLRQTVGPGVLLIRATDGTERFQIRLCPSRGSLEVQRGEDPTPVFRGEFQRGGIRATTLDISLFDRHLTVGMDGSAVVELPYETARARRPSAAPFSLGVERLAVDIESIRIYRDVYYTHPIWLPRSSKLDKPTTLGGDVFYVLGDNSPISKDSRVGTSFSGVPGYLLVGKPFVALSGSAGFLLGPWHIQVPDLAGIRYIR